MLAQHFTLHTSIRVRSTQHLTRVPVSGQRLAPHTGSRGGSTLHTSDYYGTHAPCVVKKTPLLYGARSEIWYRKETKWRVDTSVLSLRHTNQAIWTAVGFVFYDTGA